MFRQHRRRNEKERETEVITDHAVPLVPGSKFVKII
jgi:hypothetical protein